jgi:RNA polymerase sigma-70 factor (ECF subfamily)
MPPADHETDAKLCREARQGRKAAFTRLFELHYSPAYAFSFRMCLDSAAAEDVVQESFIKAARRLGDLREGVAFRAWLWQIVANGARDWHRMRQRRTALERSAAEGTAQTPSSYCDHEPVYEALAQLPREWREAVALVYFEDVSHAEAAQVLGCAETTVSWRIFRAKRKLRELLGGQNP